MAILEILFPFIGYWFWNWNILETCLALLIEIVINLLFFMLKCYYHIIQKQVLLHYFKTGPSLLLWLLRIPGALLSIGLVSLAYLVVFGVPTALIIDSLERTMATDYLSQIEFSWTNLSSSIGEDAWTYIYLGAGASILMKLGLFVQYCKQNTFNVDPFIWLMPPEYMNTKHIKVLAAGSLIIYAFLFVTLRSQLIIYNLALLHLYFTLVKIYFPVSVKNH